MENKELLKFLGYWVVNSVVLLLLATLFADSVVLGNDKLTRPLAGVVSGLILTGVLYLVPWGLTKSGLKIKRQEYWPVIFFIANVVVIWIIKRLAIITGLGISNVLWVLVVSVVVTIFEWVVGEVSKSILKK